MPEPNTHIAAGLGTAYVGAKLLGLDVDYLIVGAVGALFALSRSQPEPLQAMGHFLIARAVQFWGVTFNVGAVSFFAATSTSIGVHAYPPAASVAVPIAGLVGFFGAPIIKSVSEFISRAWRVAIKRLGGSDADTGH